jgi:hypothetical protein
MAKAAKNTKTVITETVTLELSAHEAEALAAVLRRVAGSPDSSPRKLTSGVLNALRIAGVRDIQYSTGFRLGISDLRHSADLITVDSAVTFSEYPGTWSKAERGEGN